MSIYLFCFWNVSASLKVGKYFLNFTEILTFEFKMCLKNKQRVFMCERTAF